MSQRKLHNKIQCIRNFILPYTMFKLNRFCKIFSYYNKISITKQRLPLNSVKLWNVSGKTFRLSSSTLVSKLKTKGFPVKSLLALNILSWLGFIDDDEEKESELIMTLKRAVLSSKREQYDKAEQLLHLALRLAQQQQNSQGITYCYDLMANVAFNRYELDKAEKLFVSVLQRLLGGGTSQDDLKVIHISLKLARICHLKAEEEKADLGYNWCLDQISKKHNPDFDTRVLYGVIQDWYAQFLLDRGEVQKSIKHLKEAYTACTEINGKQSEQSMLLLNDLGITSWRAGDIEGAQGCLTEAVSIGQNLEDKAHVGVVNANLGLIYLEKGILEQAEKYCKEAWHLGKRHENNESIKQANYCFEQIKISLSK